MESAQRSGGDRASSPQPLPCSNIKSKQYCPGVLLAETAKLSSSLKCVGPTNCFQQADQLWPYTAAWNRVWPYTALCNHRWPYTAACTSVQSVTKETGLE